MTTALLALITVGIRLLGRVNRDAIYDVQHECLRALGET